MVSVSPASERDGLGVAAEALAGGSVVAIPTDTVYGLAVVPSVPGAVDRLFAAQGATEGCRPPGSGRHLGGRHNGGRASEGCGRAAGCPVLARTTDPGRPPERRVLHRPGRASLGPDTVGVRWPARHRRAAVPGAGPLGRHQRQPPRLPAGVDRPPGRQRLRRRRAGVILDGGPCDGVPSTVVECLGRPRDASVKEPSLGADIAGPPVGGASRDGSDERAVRSPAGSPGPLPFGFRGQSDTGGEQWCFQPSWSGPTARRQPVRRWPWPHSWPDRTAPVSTWCAGAHTSAAVSVPSGGASVSDPSRTRS